MSDHTHWFRGRSLPAGGFEIDATPVASNDELNRALTYLAASNADKKFFPLVGRSVCDICRGRLEPGALVMKARGPTFPRIYYCKRCIDNKDAS